jgi:hypothetical protein
MALKAKSMFLYGYQILPTNASIDFRATIGGPVIQATIRVGYYSLTALLQECARAMNLADPDHQYTWTADRTVAGGLENRVSVSTDGTYLDLLFGSGPRTGSSVAYTIGFNPVDRTGATSYTGNRTSGTTLVTTLPGYNYLRPEFNHKAFGAVNVSASGRKEAIVFQIQRFVQVQFKYEPEIKALNEWGPLCDWMSQQRLFEFTPEVTSPNTFYEVTLEKSQSDGKGMGFSFKEMLPSFPFLYDIGMMTFRVNQ